MKINILATAALLAAVIAAPAAAVTLQYTLTGNDNDIDSSVEFARFRIDSNPVILPKNVGLGEGFRVKFLSGIFQYGATVFTLRDIGFANDAIGGGFFDLDPTDSVGTSTLLNVTGPQLYSGSEAAPTLLTGDFSVFDAYSSAPLSLSVTAVPEPAAWGMMVTGFGLVGGVARRRGAMAVAA